MIDIEKLEAAALATRFVRVAGTEQEPVGFTVLGPGSDEYQMARRASNIHNIRASAAEQGKPVDMSTEQGAAMIVDGSEHNDNTLLSACVVGWQGFGANGEPLPFAIDAAHRVFKRKPEWRTTVLEAIAKQEVFSQG